MTEGGELMEILIIILLVIVISFLIWDRLRSGERWKEQSNTLAKTVGEQIADTTKVFGEVKDSLGKLTERTEQIREVGKNISSLQEILRSPKPRGSLGELFLERLLADSLTAEFYELQHKFRNGDTVDAVVRIGDNLVPIDAKFPLEDFERMVQAEEEEKETLKKQFARSVKKHIDVVAKYILPDENTFDFALMYVPAENIYYETICQSDIYSYCMQKKVFLVSPNSFNAYLQAIALGLKGLRIEKTAREILGRLERLKSDFATFQRDYEVLGGHIHKASIKYEEASSKLTRLGDKLQIVGETSIERLPEGSTETSEKTDSTQT